MAYAEPEQLAARWRALTTDETAKAQTLLDDAAFWLRVWVPGLGAAVDANPESDAAQGAMLLSIAMVKRAMLAEDTDTPGAQSRSEVAGIFTEQVTFRNPEGNLYLLDREQGDLQSIVTGAPRGAVSYTARGL